MENKVANINTIPVEIKKSLTEFIVEFIKILIQTNIYTQDHPIVQKRIALPFKLFKDLHLPLGEFSFILVYSFDQAEEISVEGPTNEPVNIEKLIQSSMAEHFIRRLKDYFEKNHVVSLTIKQRISQEHFMKFLSLFTGATSESSLAEDFSTTLLNHEIVDVSVLLLEDVAGVRRRLPWRVRMAIARLRKDLKHIPLYAKATKEELKEAKENIIKDIIRPLIRPDFIKELLVNADLIKKGIKEIQEIEVEDEIVNILEGKRLLSVIWDTISSIEKLKIKYPDRIPPEFSDYNDRLFVVLKKLALKLAKSGDKETFETLSYLFKNKILEFRDLPEELQKIILREEWTAKFLKNPSLYIENFFNEKDSEKLDKYIYTFLIILPELLKKEQFSWIEKILLVFESRMIEPLFQNLFHENFDELDKELIFNFIMKNLNRLKKPERKIVYNLIQFLGEDGAEFMVKILRENEEMTIRREVCDEIEKAGKSAIPYLMRTLERKDLEWYVIRNIIMILGNIGEEGVFSEIVRYLHHPKGRIREEAMTALFKIRKDLVANYIEEHLDDDFLPVKKKAITYLSLAKKATPKLLNLIYEIVRPKKLKEKDERSDMMQVALNAIAALGNQKINDDYDFSDLLCDAINPKHTWWKIRVFGTGYKPKPEKVQVQICKILGDIGTKRSIKILSKLTKSKNEELALQAQESLKKVQLRVKSSLGEEEE